MPQTGCLPCSAFSYCSPIADFLPTEAQRTAHNVSAYPHPKSAKIIHRHPIAIIDYRSLFVADFSDNVVRLALPILPERRDILDATPSDHMTYLANERGQPFTVAGFGNKFRDWCDQAGLPHRSARGIRKADAALAAENSATINEPMAMLDGTVSIRPSFILARLVRHGPPLAQCTSSGISHQNEGETKLSHRQRGSRNWDKGAKNSRTKSEQPDHGRGYLSARLLQCPASFCGR